MFIDELQYKVQELV
ncbi:MAG: hypothetical protein CISAcid_17390, partial [uncultured Acidilobus sp. CIS]